MRQDNHGDDRPSRRALLRATAAAALTAAALTAGVGRETAAAALTPSTWDANGDGFAATIYFDTLDANGNVAGKFDDGTPLAGFWNDAESRITFYRVAHPNNPAALQIFTGYLVQPQPDSGTSVALTGYYEGFRGTGAVARRSIYGWYATLKTGP